MRETEAFSTPFAQGESLKSVVPHLTVEPAFDNLDSRRAALKLALKNHVVTALWVWHEPCLYVWVSNKGRMLKISIIESHNQRRVIVEGKLIALWVAELKTACERARADLEDRELVIDLKNVTAINPDGENLLLELMNQRVKFRCGVFTEHLLKELTRRRRGSIQNAD